MQEYTSPGEVSVAPDENLTNALWRALETAPDRPAVAHRVGDQFVEWTTRQLVDEIRGVAKGLKAIGIEKGDKVAIYSSTRLEWTVLDFAIWTAGAITVPIYETSSAEQIEWIVSDAGVKAILVESPDLMSTYDQVKDKLPGCEHIFVIDEGALEHLKQQGADVSDADITAVATSVVGSDVATIVYTSGTTGRPKGCVITHTNFVWDAEQVAEAAKEFFKPGKRTLLFLPLAHIFARVIQTTCVRNGVLLGFSTGIPQLVEELGIFKPDFLLAVPRVFEKVFNGARQKAHDEGKGKIFDKAAAVAEEYSRATLGDGKVSLGTKVLHTVFDKLVYTKLRAAMGGNVQYAVSGGAALGDRLGHFFHGIGITVLEGYGLTETTAGACIGRPTAFKVGTVGKPVPGASVKIADDGEILLKGGNVFEGYYNNDEATKEVLDDDGWFHSGDLGQVDGEGFVRITGRKKEIIVTAGGKNVAPAVLEDRMRAHPLISQCMVVGDNQPFIAALVTIDVEAFPKWAEDHGKSGGVADHVDDADLRAEIQHAIDDANQAVSKAESIRTFRILPEDFEVGNELSQKMSVKRHVVSEKYDSVISDIYADVKR
ncbi:MAG: long-chain fatty acid--CoA ligase [Nitriliruptoraceae bacterium]|nr:long-chain fatty acid--CoA ligase [Nitriliruptoraceae bacterium]